MQAAQIVDVFSRRRRGLGPRGGAFQRTMERFLAECAAAGGVRDDAIEQCRGDAVTPKGRRDDEAGDSNH